MHVWTKAPYIKYILKKFFSKYDKTRCTKAIGVLLIIPCRHATPVEADLQKYQGSVKLDHWQWFPNRLDFTPFYDLDTELYRILRGFLGDFATGVALLLKHIFQTILWQNLYQIPKVFPEEKTNSLETSRSEKIDLGLLLTWYFSLRIERTRICSTDLIHPESSVKCTIWFKPTIRRTLSISHDNYFDRQQEKKWKQWRSATCS